MGIWRNVIGLGKVVNEVTANAPTFAVDAESIPPEVFGLAGYSAPTAPAARIDRRTAIQCPAVKRSRDLICGTLGGLPLDLIGPGLAGAPSRLFEQPEKNVPRSVTMARLFEDLFFEQTAWWQVTEFDWTNYPKHVKRLRPGRVTVDEDRGVVYVDGREVPSSELIRFDSPTDGLLIAGARAIRTALQLDNAAANASDGTPPVDYFMPAEDADPVGDEDVKQILADWRAARRAGSTAYVPAALKYMTGGWDPKQLQLAEQRQHAVLEIARCAGVDPEDLGVSTTSRTYANAETRRRDLLDFTLAAYLIAVTDRLSMGDVTPRGYYARFNLDAFLRSDTKTRYEAYEIGLRVGALTKPEIRHLEDRPPITDPDGQAVGTTNQEESVNAPSLAADAVTGLHIVNFDTGPELRLDASASTTQSFEVDVEKRIVKGLIVPYGVPAFSNGKQWQFSKGSLKFADPRRVKLWVQHDPNRAVGVATELDDRADGMYGTFSIARGAEGDRVLELAEDGVLDGFSIGLGRGVKARLQGDVNHVFEAPLMETSLTPSPSFDDARVHSVAASAAGQGGEGSDLGVMIAKALMQGFGHMQFPQRENVSAAEGLEIHEPSPYRFDGTRGEHCFSDDLRDMNQGDTDARQRIETFMTEAFAEFAVTTANVGTLNPTKNRPDLYVPNLQFTRPLWDLVTTGSLDDQTPFTIPKFASATGLVGDHTQGVEPTPGAFAATSQTVTPGPLSGKIEINREVWDQGGSPQADGIIWGEMLNAWFEAIEAKIAARLAAIGTAELNLASATDAALVNALTGYFAGLQFVRGGNRFTAFAADGNLFPALVGAKDSAGRPLLPVLGPQNAQGETSGSFDRVQLGNQSVRAAWALGTGNDKKSYNFVPTSVWAWTSAPKRFQFEYQVKSIDLAIWGYAATAVTRDSDVKPIDYTTADA